MVAIAAPVGVIGFLVGVGRGVIVERHGSVRDWMAGIAAACVVAVLLGWALRASRVDWMWTMVVVGVCSYIAQDVLAGLSVLGGLIRTDPLGGIGRIIDAIRTGGRGGKDGG